MTPKLTRRTFLTSSSAVTVAGSVNAVTTTPQQSSLQYPSPNIYRWVRTQTQNAGTNLIIANGSSFPKDTDNYVTRFVFFNEAEMDDNYTWHGVGLRRLVPLNSSDPYPFVSITNVDNWMGTSVEFEVPVFFPSGCIPSAWLRNESAALRPSAQFFFTVEYYTAIQMGALRESANISRPDPSKMF